MKPLTWGYSTALVNEALASNGLSQFLSELETFNSALLRLDQLMFLLEDPTVTKSAKVSTISDILANKTSQLTKLGILFAVRTERSSNLVETLQEIQKKSALHSESWMETGSEPSSSRQVARDRMIGYTKFYCDYTTDGNELDKVEDEIFGFARAVEKNSQLRWTLADLVIPVETRLALVNDILTNAREITKKLSRYVLLAGRMRDVVSALDEIAAEISRERGRRIAEVRTAVELTTEQKEKLIQNLTQSEQIPIELRVVVEPELIAGIVLTVGNKMLDTSFRSKFSEMSQELYDAV